MQNKLVNIFLNVFVFRSQCFWITVPVTFVDILGFPYNIALYVVESVASSAFRRRAPLLPLEHVQASAGLDALTFLILTNNSQDSARPRQLALKSFVPWSPAAGWSAIPPGNRAVPAVCLRPRHSHHRQAPRDPPTARPTVMSEMGKHFKSRLRLQLIQFFLSFPSLISFLPSCLPFFPISFFFLFYPLFYPNLFFLTP